MVQDNGDLVLVKDLSESRLVKLGNGYRSGDIVAQHQIQLSLNELSGLHGRKARMLCQDLLGHGHTHVWSLLFV